LSNRVNESGELGGKCKAVFRNAYDLKKRKKKKMKRKNQTPEEQEGKKVSRKKHWERSPEGKRERRILYCVGACILLKYKEKGKKARGRGRFAHPDGMFLECVTPVTNGGGGFSIAP